LNTYHYTSLSSLEKILISKSIRFSNLSFVNDKYEGETQDIGNIGKNIYISCWTLKKTEDSLMWKMYGNESKGVRICMELPIFNLFYDDNNNPSIIPNDGLYIGNCMLFPSENDKHFVKIKYTDSAKYLKPKALFDFPLVNAGMFNYGSIGKCKSTKWQYENENRFIIYSLPIVNKEDFMQNPTFAIGESIMRMRNNFDTGVKYVDIELNTKAFSGMKIFSGREMGISDKEKLKSMIKKYNPTAKLNESNLRI